MRIHNRQRVIRVVAWLWKLLHVQARLLNKEDKSMRLERGTRMFKLRIAGRSPTRGNLDILSGLIQASRQGGGDANRVLGEGGGCVFPCWYSPVRIDSYKPVFEDLTVTDHSPSGTRMDSEDDNYAQRGRMHGGGGYKGYGCGWLSIQIGAGIIIRKRASRDTHKPPPQPPVVEPLVVELAIVAPQIAPNKGKSIMDDGFIEVRKKKKKSKGPKPRVQIPSLNVSKPGPSKPSGRSKPIGDSGVSKKAQNTQLHVSNPFSALDDSTPSDDSFPELSAALKMSAKKYVDTNTIPPPDAFLT
ncbi:hypothetical protein L1987_73042 [Smallanthus sonchifolius]|uniref:Uncharacterized protein n=1 Tax=Smallanthus sonchifolius TaxID=185202 RepID=A0ACB9AWW7_9ASTR|nr:hypothetical protein L1987_73042 [Smallanthus sonchifolius]